MSRVVVPKKADKKLYRWAAETFDGEAFGMIVGAMTILGVPFMIGAAIDFSLLFLLLLIPYVLFIAGGGKLYLNSIYSSNYSKSLYAKAYEVYDLTLHPDSRRDARVLLENVWTHEKAVSAVGKLHDSKHSCADCARRVQLMEDFKDSQPIAGTDTSDIESLEMKLSVRKELSA